MARPLSVQRVDASLITTARRLPADAYGVAALVLLTGIVAWDRLGSYQGLSRTDILTFYLPWYAYLGEHLRAFDVPAWNPHIFGGVPFAGDPQSGWMYAPAMLFFTILPPAAAFTVFIVFHLAFAGVTTYALARVLGMRVAGSLVAAVAYEFGTFVEHTRCCTIRAQLAAWLPLALLGVELAARSRSWGGRLGWCAVAGFAVSQMLAAWIGQGAYDGLLIVGGYIGYRTLLGPAVRGGRLRQRARDLGVVAAAVFAVGFGLAAAGVLPRLAAVERSNLAGGEYEDSGGRSGGWSVVHLVDRLLSDDSVSVRWYQGGATLALALLAPVVARRRYGTAFFAGTALAVLTLTLDHTWLHDLLYLLPKFQTLHQHVPNRVLVVLPIATAILAGATVDSMPRWSRRRWAPFAAALPLAALGAILVVLDRQDRMISATAIVAIVVVGVLLVAATALVSSWGARRMPRAMGWQGIIPILLVVVVFWDPTGQWHGESMRDLPPDRRSTETVATFAATTDAGAAAFLHEQTEDEPGRYFGYEAGLLGLDRDAATYQGLFRRRLVQDLLVNNRAMRLDLEDAQGYSPIQPIRYVEFFEALNGEAQNYHDANVLPNGLTSPLLDLLNVRYVVVPLAVPPGRPDLMHLSQRHRTVFVGDRVRVVENEEALPRAWIVHEARQVPGDEGLDLLKRGGVDPRRTVVLYDAAPPLAEPLSADGDAVTIEQDEADEVRLTVRTSADGLLVVSESYDPGWRAYVDGKRTPVLIADHVLRAVPLPAGEHTVVLRYEPPMLRLGLAISGLTILLLIGGVVGFTMRPWMKRRT